MTDEPKPPEAAPPAPQPQPEAVKPLNEREFLKIYRTGGVPADLPALIATVVDFSRHNQAMAEELRVMRNSLQILNSAMILVVKASGKSVATFNCEMMNAIPKGVELQIKYDQAKGLIHMVLVEPEIVVPKKIIRLDDFKKNGE